MKLSVFLPITALADEKKVPPRHPLQRLNRLVQFSAEILDDWYGFLSSQEKWKQKFATNAARMEKNFQRGNQRCGYFSPSLPHGGPNPQKSGRKRRDDSYDAYDYYDYDEEDVFRYDRENPSKGTKQITTGFRKWALRYLSDCSGQKNYNYQVNRMNRWNKLLQAHLAKNDAEKSGN